MNDEIKQLIEDAAKLLGYPSKGLASKFIAQGVSKRAVIIGNARGGDSVFDPLDPSRGDLMKVAEAAELVIGRGRVATSWYLPAAHQFGYLERDYQSLALAVLRAASAVLKARGRMMKQEAIEPVGSTAGLCELSDSDKLEWYRLQLDHFDEQSKQLGETLIQCETLRALLIELMGYNPRIRRIGGIMNGKDVPTGAAMLDLLDRCDAALWHNVVANSAGACASPGSEPTES